MALAVGSRIGPYEVLGVIGAGGMGEVYRARDTKLQRDVAVKVLPDSVAGSPRRLVRFEREARALAALNHPNIATVYGIEEASGRSEHGHALVMEFVAGEDLSWRLKRGPIPLADALPIARQIAEALAAAHDAGIVHRDLKPANIKVRADGTVKVLDFGLATARAAETETETGSGSGSGSGSSSGSGELLNTLTLGPDVTEDGAVVGTVAYMPPEQAKGRPVDKRADIWAFGVLLFEMLTGQRPFRVPAGKDAAEVVALILTAEPDWKALPSGTPPPIRRLLARCLTKERRQRLHDIADARLEIDEAIDPQLPGTWTDRARSKRSTTRWLIAGTTLLVAVAAGAALAVQFWRTAPPADTTVIHTLLDVSPAAELDGGGMHPLVVLPVGGANTALAWSPDGNTLAFIGKADGVRKIYLRDLADDTARAIEGTDDAVTFTFSPDGSEIAFGTSNTIKRVKVSGGPVAVVCSTTAGRGMTWGRRGLIVSRAGLATVDLTSGDLRVHLSTENLTRYTTPFLLPGDRGLLFTELHRQWTSGDERVMVQRLSPAEPPRILLPNAADARYVASGHLLFMRAGTLFAVKFDLEKLEVQGVPVPLIKNVAQSAVAWDSDDLTLGGQFALSSKGTLAYVASPANSYPEGEVLKFDRTGRSMSVGAPPLAYRNHVEVSPDGRRLAVAVQTNAELQLYAFDLERKTMSRIAETISGELVLGSWSPAGKLAIGVVDTGDISATVVGPDAATVPVPIPNSLRFWPTSMSADGYVAGMKAGGIWIYPPGATSTPIEFQTSRFSMVQPVWSPDRRWIAYVSNATGRDEVYLRAYGESPQTIPVSTRGGASPAWNRATGELLYVEPGRPEKMMSVTLSPAGQVLRTSVLFDVPAELALGSGSFTTYAVSPDGSTFYASRLPRRGAPVTNINLVQNWMRELQDKVR